MSWLKKIYAPPVETAEARRAMRDGRAELLAAAATLCAAIFACLLFSALLLRIASLRPAGLLPADWYSVIFAFHGAMAVAFASGLKLLLLAAWSPIEARENVRDRLFLRALAGALALVGLQAAVAACLAPLDPPLWVALVALWAPGIAVAGCLAWAAVLSVRTDPAPVLVLLGSAIASVATRPADDDLAFLLCVVALSSTLSRRRSEPVHERLYSGRSAILLALSALLAFRGIAPWAEGALSVFWFCASLYWVATLWKLVSPPSSPEVRWTARTGLALFALGLTLQLSLTVLSSESFLEDTLLAVAVHHATVFGLTFLALAVAFSEVRAIRSLVVEMRLAVTISLAGTLGFAVLFATLGVRGMPLRYMAYLPEFFGLQVAASIAALMLAAGFAGIALAVLRSRAAQPAPTHVESKVSSGS